MSISGNLGCELLKNIINCFLDVAFYLDEHGYVEEFNEAAQKSFNISCPIAPNCTMAQLLHDDVFMNLKDRYTFPWSVESNGSYTLYQAYCRKLKMTPVLSGLIVILREVSDSNILTEYINQLEESNRDMDALFRFSHDGLVICDGNGYGVRYNEAYTRITGIDGQDLIGRHMTEIVERGSISESAVLNALVAKKQVTTMPNLASGKKVLITANPVFDANNNVVKVIGNVRDLTELTALEAELNQAKELSERYFSELVHLRSQTIQVEGMVAESPAMRAIISTAMKVSATDATVLITGESGAGKEVLARMIHTHSQRREGPFVKVNCGAIPDNLLESELFGYEKGAFTNAAKTGKMGIFEIAFGGTLFLDEIGEIPVSLQAKLLGVLQDKRFSRVGGTKEINLSARIIAATNRDLDEMVAAGQFRKDLFYRLNVVGLKIPPLAERREDIFPLTHYFLRELNEKYQFKNTLSHQVMNLFREYDWPGNVREMENLMEQLVVLAPNEKIIPAMLPESFRMRRVDAGSELSQGGSLEEIMDNVERRIFRTFVQKGYSSYRIAEELGINQSTAIRKIKKLGLNEK